MRTLFAFALTMVGLAGYAQFHVDTATYTILPYNDNTRMAMNWQWSNVSSASLTSKEVDSMEYLIYSAYLAFTRDSTAYLHKLLPLSSYRRQYVAVVADDGERKFWVNFFCTDFDRDWRRNPIIVDDGGNCFLQISLSWTQKKVISVIPNGVAYNNSLGTHDYRSFSYQK